jgi:hypothetical protein
MSLPSFPFAPKLGRVFHTARVRSHSDLDALLFRMRRRLYPETVPVLASYWLKTVYAAGHNRVWWKRLDSELKQALAGQQMEPGARECLAEIQAWIQRAVLHAGQSPAVYPQRIQPFRAKLTAERLAPYTVRLLNEWLPAEVASVLTNESNPFPQDEGMPVLAVAKALERLLVREHLSPACLEMLLDPEVLSPQAVYPSDAEVLRDVVLALLGRTWAPLPPVMPATLLVVARDSCLPADYSETVRRAAFVECEGREELHVPIAAAQGLEILKGTAMRIGSIVVTMDGRWWESERLQSGEQYEIVYRPGGRLRIDYSADHAKLVMPWPQTELSWSGAVHFPPSFEIFGREWHPVSWETNGERTWLHLEFSRVLKADVCLPRSHQASIDIAWTALEGALAAALVQESSQPIEELRHSDLIPLARALFEFMECIKSNRPKGEMLVTKLKAIEYFQAQTSVVHGRVPWKTLPAPIRKTFLKGRSNSAFLELLRRVFDDLPPEFGHANSPSQAA